MLLDIFGFILLAGAWFFIYQDYEKVIIETLLGISFTLFLSSTIIQMRKKK